MKKKLVAGAVTLLSVVTLAACANGTNKDIVTMKGDTITVSDFYNEIKNNQGAQQVLFQMTINKVFEKEYGSKVSDKEVDKELAKQKKQLGNRFDAYLAQQGLTEETAKKQIRSNMLLEYAVNQAAKKDIKESDYKAAFESYTPEVTAQIIKLDAEDKAAAFKLDENGISDVITVSAGQNYSASYYIVKLNKKTEKGSDWKKYEKRLKEIIVDGRKQDTNYIRSIIAKAMTNANIKVKDDAFKSTFNQYLQNIGVQTSDSSSSSKK